MILESSVIVFIPKQLQNYQDCHLYGKISFVHDSLTDKEMVAIVLFSQKSLPEHLVGCIANNHQYLSRKLEKDVWLELKTEPSITVSCLFMKGKMLRLDDITHIVYDRLEICESEILKGRYSVAQDECEGNVFSFFIKSVLESEDERVPQARTEMRTFVFIDLIVGFLTWIVTILMRQMQCRFKALESISKAIHQITLRLTHFGSLYNHSQMKTNNIVSGHLATMIIIDILLGITVAHTISSYATWSDVYDSFRTCTKALSSSVQDLLEWLSGAPAGLKLNQPLTQALSAFFSYHVHLWKLYLDLAEPLLKGVSWILVWLGMLGLSVQIAILSDLLDLATLHLYCFYVYAARIHMLQISLLGSQWRAFRGRKWNPLKGRMDSDIGVHLPLNRVLTAVVFTLVIFLLPTTTVYYLVFVMEIHPCLALHKQLAIHQC
ncbi:hypothetical protein SK128_018964 [Halocaridina rubra]|uniref:Phosphatidylinositol N-acetylglucosaminyltransferase subunit Q n=1 Tax=Halocaridina rubra TaxID=373956 RepID=A0AAN8WYK0_HALRR